MPLTKATTNVVNLNKDTLINGLTVGRGNGNFGSNTALGSSALSANTTGIANTAIGEDALSANTTGNNNTAVGSNTLSANTTGNNNTASGVNALLSNTSGDGNTATGVNALSSNTLGINNTAIGSNALTANTSGDSNTATGRNSLSSNTLGINNTATGINSLLSNTTADNCAAVGVNSLFSNTTGNENTAIGSIALYTNTSGFSNVAVGYAALYNNTTGDENTALGWSALSLGTNYGNTTGIGHNAEVTGSNQVQLGDSATTTYVYGTVQNRSDIRDKADVKDTTLGLEFVNALRPVDFKWDMREDYRPEAPAFPAQDASEEEKATYEINKAKWLEDSKLANITHDGSKKRKRFHHGLIAQEVKAVLDAKGIDFGGFQNHSINGGDDVLSIGYEELIAPLIKAIQELSAKVAELENK